MQVLNTHLQTPRSKLIARSRRERGNKGEEIETRAGGMKGDGGKREMSRGFSMERKRGERRIEEESREDE